MDRRTDIRMLLAERDPTHSLERPFYTDPEVFELDLEAIWYRKWLFVGHTCEIPKAGNYFTMSVGSQPVVVVRGPDQVVRAFHNVCRHRGARVCRQERGNAARLVCPYRQWTYGLDGALVYARDMEPGFDAAAHGLMPVACETVAGYIFISLAEEPEDFGTFRAVAEPYLAPHRLDQAKVAAQSTIVEKGNWKIVMENNRECYHCAGGHPELARVYDDSPAFNGASDSGDVDAVGYHWGKCEALGLPSRFRIAHDAQWRLVRSPFRKQAVSMTMTGKAACRVPMTTVNDPALGSLMMFVYPNTWNHLMADHAVTFQVMPLGPHETQVTTRWPVHRDAVGGVDYTVDDLTRVWTATNDQDRFFVEEAQAGVMSHAYRPGPFAPGHEDGVRQFVDWYAWAILDHLDPGHRRLRAVAG